jgi:hypothetical protein
MVERLLHISKLRDPDLIGVWGERHRLVDAARDRREAWGQARHAISVLAAHDIRVVSAARSLVEVDEQTLCNTVIDLRLCQGGFGWALLYLTRLKMFDPELSGVLDLSRLYGLQRVGRSVVVSELQVGGRPYFAHGGDGALQQELEELLAQSSQLSAVWKSNGERTLALALKLAEVSDGVAGRAMACGRERAEVLALSFLGRARLFAAKQHKREGREVDRGYLTGVYESQMRGGRISWFLMHEGDDTFDHAANLAYHLDYVAESLSLRRDFAEAVEYRREAVARFETLWEAEAGEEGPGYRPINCYSGTLKAVYMALEIDCREAGLFLEMARAKWDQAWLLWQTGDQREACNQLWYAALKLMNRPPEQVSREELEFARKCLEKEINLLQSMRISPGFINKAREKLEELGGRLDAS